MRSQLIERPLPECAIALNEQTRVVERLGIQVAALETASALAADKPGALQYVQVLGDGCERDRKWLRQLADAGRSAGQPAHELTPGRVREGVEDLVETLIALGGRPGS